jgi:dTDP-4-amino-4,6-dideoxygalactose transaminase
MMSPETPKIQEFCHKNNILLVEDCAQSLGAQLGEKPAGSFGDFSTFSFHSQKNITLIGEGGMLAVSNSEIASKVTGMRHNGHSPFKGQTEYWLPAMTNVDEDMTNQWPYNFSMTEVQAALGSCSLKRLNKMINRRRQRALKFREAFSGYKELQFQKIDDPEAHSHHLLPAKFCSTQKDQNRNDLIKLLYKEYRVKAIVQYYPLHRYDLFKKKGYGYAECPESELFFDNMISFPFNLIMSESDFDYMIDSTKKSLETLRCKT